MSIHAVGPLDIESLSAEMADPVRAKVEEAAAWRGVPVSSFVIEAASRAADEVIERERLIQLTRADADQILNLLENPPEPNASLRIVADVHHRLIVLATIGLLLVPGCLGEVDTPHTTGGSTTTDHATHTVLKENIPIDRTFDEGWCAEWGLGQKIDDDKAKSLYVRAAGAGDPFAIGWMRCKFLDKENHISPTAFEKATAQIRAKAEAGDARAQLIISQCLLRDPNRDFPTRDQQKESVKWIRRAADQKLPEAMVRLGEMLQHSDFRQDFNFVGSIGDAMRNDREQEFKAEAEALFRAAARQQLPEGQYRLAAVCDVPPAEEAHLLLAATCKGHESAAFRQFMDKTHRILFSIDYRNIKSDQKRQLEIAAQIQKEKRSSFLKEEQLGGAKVPLSQLASPSTTGYSDKNAEQQRRQPTGAIRQHKHRSKTDFPDAATILPGAGIARCQLGSWRDEADDAFGRASRYDDNQPYFFNVYRDAGVEINYDNDTVYAMHFYFSLNKYDPEYFGVGQHMYLFKGSAHHNIDRNSSPEQVIQAYGKPDETLIWQAYMSRSFVNGSRFMMLTYKSLGISFIFTDGILFKITVFIPTNT